MPTIRVTVASLEYEPVLEYYNTHKNESWPSLEKLNRAEGGFMIQIPEMIDVACYNSNEKIRQLRWSRRCLVPEKSFPYFTDEETMLLGEALIYVLGEACVNVIYTKEEYNLLLHSVHRSTLIVNNTLILTDDE